MMLRIMYGFMYRTLIKYGGIAALQFKEMKMQKFKSNITFHITFHLIAVMLIN